MVYISVNIEKAESSRLPLVHIGYVAAVFVIGAVIGLIVSNNIKLPLPNNSASNLAAIAAIPQSATSTQTSEDVISSENEAVLGTLSTQDVTTETQPDLILPLFDDTTRKELEAKISDTLLVIERLSLEMLRVKNESLSIISEFNQNCANWNDECAIPYKTSLDRNNATYERLMVAQNQFNTEMSIDRDNLASLDQ